MCYFLSDLYCMLHDWQYCCELKFFSFLQGIIIITSCMLQNLFLINLIYIICIICRWFQKISLGVSVVSRFARIICLDPASGEVLHHLLGAQSLAATILAG